MNTITLRVFGVKVMNFDLVWGYILVFLLAAVPFIESAILTPVAIIAGLSTVPVILLAIGGNLLTVYIVILFVDKARRWYQKDKEGEKSKKRTQRAKKVWDKYGVAGLALIGPFFIGSHLSAFLSLVFGGTKKKVFVWMTSSIVLWSVGLAILAQFGVTLLNIEHTFLDRFFQTSH